MRRRLLGLLAVVGLALVLGSGALWWLAWADRITPGNAARVKPGISLVAVNQLLGQPGRAAPERPCLPCLVGLTVPGSGSPAAPPPGCLPGQRNGRSLPRAGPRLLLSRPARSSLFAM